MTLASRVLLALLVLCSVAIGAVAARDATNISRQPAKKVDRGDKATSREPAKKVDHVDESYAEHDKVRGPTRSAADCRPAHRCQLSSGSLNMLGSIHPLRDLLSRDDCC